MEQSELESKVQQLETGTVMATGSVALLAGSFLGMAIAKD